jgi:hypothetical protein
MIRTLAVWGSGRWRLRVPFTCFSDDDGSHQTRQAVLYWIGHESKTHGHLFAFYVATLCAASNVFPR